MIELRPLPSLRARSSFEFLRVLRLVLLFLGITVHLKAESVSLVWNPNPESDIAGYQVHYGTASGQLVTVKDVGNVTGASLSGLASATTYHFAVLAYNRAGLKSPLSAEISFTTRAVPLLQLRDTAGVPLEDGGVQDFGLVNLGALSDTRTFTITNTGSTTLNGLSLVLEGAAAGGFIVTGDLAFSKFFDINGSFESRLDSWQASGNVEADTIAGTSDGRWAAVFGTGDSANTGVLSRSLPTIPGARYTLEFDAGVISYNTNEQRLRTTVSGTADLLADTAILNGAGGGSVIWSSRSFSFMADSLATKLEFADISTNTAAIDLLLDKVRVTETGAATGGAVVSSLAPGKSVSFSVTFRAAAAGAGKATLRLNAEGTVTPLFELNLTGSGNALFKPWLSSVGATGGATDNPDGDGLNNLLEFAFGTDPTTPQSKGAAESGGRVTSRGTPVVRISTSPVFEFRGQFGRRKNHATAGLVYRPQFSADLITWVNTEATPTVHADDGEIEVVSVRAPESIQGDVPRFFRVGVEEIGPVALEGWLVQQGAGAANDNPDGDGLDNLFEFAFGTDPAVPQAKVAAEMNGLLASRGAPAVRVRSAPGAPDFEFSGLFCRRKDRAAHGLAYRPQFSADLMTWVDAGGEPEVRADDGEIEVVSMAAPAHINGKIPRFFRVGLSQSAP